MEFFITNTPQIIIGNPDKSNYVYFYIFKYYNKKHVRRTIGKPLYSIHIISNIFWYF